MTAIADDVVPAEAAAATDGVAPTRKNVHGFMAFGISSTALIVGTAAIGAVSIMASLGLPGWLYRASVVTAHALPLLLGAWGVYHGITAFVLAKRGIPCHKESEFAAFLGIVIGLAVIGMFLWFGVLTGPRRAPRGRPLPPAAVARDPRDPAPVSLRLRVPERGTLAGAA